LVVRLRWVTHVAVFHTLRTRVTFEFHVCVWLLYAFAFVWLDPVCYALPFAFALPHYVVVVVVPGSFTRLPLRYVLLPLLLVPFLLLVLCNPDVFGLRLFVAVEHAFVTFTTLWFALLGYCTFTVWFAVGYVAVTICYIPGHLPLRLVWITVYTLHYGLPTLVTLLPLHVAGSTFTLHVLDYHLRCYVAPCCCPGCVTVRLRVTLFTVVYPALPFTVGYADGYVASYVVTFTFGLTRCGCCCGWVVYRSVVTLLWFGLPLFPHSWLLLLPRLVVTFRLVWFGLHYDLRLVAHGYGLLRCYVYVVVTDTLRCTFTGPVVTFGLLLPCCLPLPCCWLIPGFVPPFPQHTRCYGCFVILILLDYVGLRRFTLMDALLPYVVVVVAFVTFVTPRYTRWLV